MATDDPESLGSTMSKQIDDFQSRTLTSDLSRLKDSCAEKKIERSRLISECAQKSAERDSIASHIAALKNERDILRSEVESTGREREVPYQGGESLSSSVNEIGKFKRKILALELHLEQVEKQKGQIVKDEREVARGLRERIGQLEASVRVERARVEQVECAKKELDRQRKDQEEHLDSLIRSKSREIEELQSVLREANQKVAKVISERDDLLVKMSEVEAAKRAESVTPRKALQPRPANSIILSRPQSPITPTKQQRDKHQLGHLNEQHVALRSESTKRWKWRE
ncbi:hypothetical protein BD324DRAFT_7008 [Kockovaella imperatae]|uniref:Uncharacterized protein n=1 Tax=Kockovaella imperatae TaxID=4999 RepID=A0A1Y1UTM6_9TREE|nr:hypothetical protein BD324DRAFT_7008 [Kockovaella imperatae]ORX40545.1 hypothetical protein BD324DRAFT_7008 [Kockovaella imperatae]